MKDRNPHCKNFDLKTTIKFPKKIIRDYALMEVEKFERRMKNIEDDLMRVKKALRRVGIQVV